MPFSDPKYEIYFKLKKALTKYHTEHAKSEAVPVLRKLSKKKKTKNKSFLLVVYIATTMVYCTVPVQRK